MNLSEAMFDALERARQHAINSSGPPTGTQPLSTELGGHILDTIRRKPPPRTPPIRSGEPMSQTLGVIVNSFIHTTPTPRKTPLERYLER